MIAVLSLLIWIYLWLAHGRFWRSGPQLPPAAPAECPDVDIIIPARDEAATIGPVVASLLAQDYTGSLSVVLVDDDSSDDTAKLAGTASNLRIIRGVPKPAGWSGKLWALNQGIAASRASLLLFTDADIVHDPRHLSSLVAKALQPGVQMVSEMVRLHCVSPAERTLIPAFVYFFQMLYPFRKVNDPHSTVAAAAGGTILIRRESLNAIGGIAAIRSAIIDDVALARAVKPLGGIYLGHSGLAESIRPYAGFADVWQMISRTAFNQLRYSVALLTLTLAGLTLVWLAPVAEIAMEHGWRAVLGLATLTLAAISYLPTLRRYHCNPAFSLLLPLIALFYMAATVGSAMNHWLGKGIRWKNRAYDATGGP